MTYDGRVRTPAETRRHAQGARVLSSSPTTTAGVPDPFVPAGAEAETTAHMQVGLSSTSGVIRDVYFTTVLRPVVARNEASGLAWTIALLVYYFRMPLPRVCTWN